MKYFIPNILLLLFVLMACENKPKDPVATPKPDPLPAFVAQLNALDQSDINSITTAVTLFDSLRLQLPNSAIADTLFYPHFWEFYQQTGQRAITDLYKKSDKDLAKAETVAEEYGLQIIDNQGGIIATPANKQYLKARVIPYLSEPMTQFVQQRLREFSYPNGDIAQIAGNALFWEKFVVQHPNSPLVSYAKNAFVKTYVPQLLIGNEAHPAFTETGKLDRSFPVVYGQVLVKEGDSQMTPILDAYMKLLKESKYERTPQVEAFLQRFLN